MAHDDWTHFVIFGPCKIFCFLNRSLQKNLFLKIVPGGTILKNKKICRDQKQIFFYRDQNLNESYLQGRVQYLTLLHDNVEFFLGNYVECCISTSVIVYIIEIYQFLKICFVKEFQQKKSISLT